MKYSEIADFLSTGNVLPREMLNALVPKRVVLLLTQTSTNAPSAVVVNNTTGIAPTLARTGTGVYTLTMTGAFVDNKTVLPTNSSKVKFTRTSGNVVTIETFSGDLTTPADGVLTSYPVSIDIWV